MSPISYEPITPPGRLDVLQELRVPVDALGVAGPGEAFDLVVSSFSAHHWPDPATGFAQIRRVLTNLVDNAIKYSPGGGPVDARVEGLHAAAQDLRGLREVAHRGDRDAGLRLARVVSLPEVQQHRQERHRAPAQGHP